MKTLTLVLNWKMNPTSKKEALALFSALKKNDKKIQQSKNKIKLILAPPAIYLDAISSKNKNTKIELSGQDIFYKKYGSYTGSISQQMLKDLGAKYSIVGHWERRKVFNEQNEDIAKKVHSLLDLKMKAIFCVGEEQRDEQGKFADFLEKQIISILKNVEITDYKNIFLAYEPVWAIGSTKEISKEEIELSIILIKKILVKNFGEKSKNIKILYGGSVNPENILNLLEIEGIDGFLLGRSGLDKNIFDKIIDNLLKI